MKEMFLILMLFSLGAFGQQIVQPRAFEEKAEMMLEEAGRQLQVDDALSIRFDYEIEDTEHGIREKMDGWLATKRDKYYMKAGPNHFVSDGETLWTYMEEVNEVHISLAEYTEDLITPTSLLDDHATRFRSKWIREERYNARTVHIIDLVPREADIFYKYRIAIEDGSLEIAYTEAHDRHGGIYRFKVTEIDYDAGLPDDHFVFDPDQYPDIEVVDLR